MRNEGKRLHRERFDTGLQLYSHTKKKKPKKKKTKKHYKAYWKILLDFHTFWCFFFVWSPIAQNNNFRKIPGHLTNGFLIFHRFIRAKSEILEYIFHLGLNIISAFRWEDLFRTAPPPPPPPPTLFRQLEERICFEPPPPPKKKKKKTKKKKPMNLFEFKIK